MDMISEAPSGENGVASTERRGLVRRRVLKGATVSFNNGYSSFECIVRNQSDHGARLVFAETFALPNSFSLAIGANAPVRATVIWRTMTDVGVAIG